MTHIWRVAIGISAVLLILGGSVAIGARIEALWGEAWAADEGTADHREAARTPLGDQDVPERRLSPPALPQGADALGDGAARKSAISHAPNLYAALGLAPVASPCRTQELSLTRIIIPPGGHLRLKHLGGSGLVLLETGRLDLMRQDGSVKLTRSATHTTAIAPGADGVPRIAAGDRFTLGPGATLMLDNTDETGAVVLAAFVLTNPGIAAANLGAYSERGTEPTPVPRYAGNPPVSPGRCG